LSVLALACATARAAEEPKSETVSGFSGIWALATSADDVAGVPPKSRWSGLGGEGGSGARPGGGGFDLPLEVMTDAHRLVVTDDGTTLRVTYPSGRTRTFVTDGRKRYLDDGDGPADVVARRKGETVTVVSEWFRGYRLRETWEVRSDPRRLVVLGKLKGRESNEYVRTYAPAPPGDASPAPQATPAATPAASVRLPWSLTAPTPTPGPPPAEAEPGGGAEPRSVDRLAECAVRPPRGARPEELRGLVRVSQEEAGKAAVASLAPLKPGDVISSDVEVFDGCLVWPFTLRLPARRGVQEVFVDAGDGKVVKSDFIRLGGPAAPPGTP
jgi:hypothetical protein